MPQFSSISDSCSSRSESRADYIYKAIFSRIVSGELGFGECITQAKCRDFLEAGKQVCSKEVSRHPYRNAISQLVSLGLVSASPGSETCVRSRPGEMESVRATMQRFAVELVAVGALTLDVQKNEASSFTHKLRRNLIEMKVLTEDISSPDIVAEFISCDMKFHTLILSLAGYDHAIPFARRLYMDSVMSWIDALRDTSKSERIMREILEEHEVCYAGIQSGNLKVAVQAMRAHIRRNESRASLGHDEIDEMFFEMMQASLPIADIVKRV